MSFFRPRFFAAFFVLSVPAIAGLEQAAGQPAGGGSAGAAASAQTPAGDRKAGDVGEYSSILQRGLFGEAGGPSSGNAPAPPSASYRLIGTLESGGFTGAVLDDGTGVQTFYRIGQKLPDESRITQVRPDRVLIKRPDGSVVELFTSDDGKSPARPAVPADGTSLSPPAEVGAPGAAQSGRQRPPRRRSFRGDD
jgi:hypothetical protein